MTRLDRHPVELTPPEAALRALLPELLCEHAHGNRPPRRPCSDHRAIAGALAFVLACHRVELLAALRATTAPALERYLASRAPELLAAAERRT